MKRLERLVTMALFLGSRRRVLARDVADRFEISVRTVYRDIKALQEAGFPIEGNAGDGYRVPQTAFVRPLALTVEEGEALTLAARSLATMVGASVRDALRSATAKLEASLEPAAQRRVRELARTVSVPEFAQRSSGPSAEVLAALRTRGVARIAYVDTRDESRTVRVVEPLGLVCLGDAWWLIAYCRLRKDARAFRLDRIASWEATDETQPARPGYSFAEVIARDGHLGRRLFGS